MRTERTEFGKAIDHKLIDLGKTQQWLIEQVKEKTGMFVDTSLIYKIKVGEVKRGRIVDAVREILGLEG